MSLDYSFPPLTAVDPVTDIIHGVSVTDPYRWLEDQTSPRTRKWIGEQTNYARSYLNSIPGRDRIRNRICEFLSVETHDSLLNAGGRYFFRRRLPEQEQASIYMRESPEGNDQLLLNPSQFGTDPFIAVKHLLASPFGRLLLFEIKRGGEQTGTFGILDVDTRKILPDTLPRGYIRGFAFAPDQISFYYVHELANSKQPHVRAAYRHVLGANISDDREVFCAGNDAQVQLCLLSDEKRLGFLVYSFARNRCTHFYLKDFASETSPELVLRGGEFSFTPMLIPGRILVLTDREAPNRRIVEVPAKPTSSVMWTDVIPERPERIDRCFVVGNRLVVSYSQDFVSRADIYDFRGNKTGEVAMDPSETTRIAGGSRANDELYLEVESFVEPVSVYRQSLATSQRCLWSKRNIPFDATNFCHSQTSFASKDGTQIPMFLMGRRDVMAGGSHPTIMTAYGGFGISMTPQFSVFVAFLVEQGCLFALPNIRGGSEFGPAWHLAAKGRNRQNAFDDFLAAADWLIDTQHTPPDKLAVFGGSTSGLLVGAALTQRPELFRAVVCMVPLLDMLRYHLFDNARFSRDEYGIADDPDDFAALSAYSPYHRVQDAIPYPAVMLVSGDADGKCNSLHARKMTARLQAASSSTRPVILDYSTHRGHAPVLPLTQRIEALTDRMAFLSHELGLPIGGN